MHQNTSTQGHFGKKSKNNGHDPNRRNYDRNVRRQPRNNRENRGLPSGASRSGVGVSGGNMGMNNGEIGLNNSAISSSAHPQNIPNAALYGSGGMQWNAMMNATNPPNTHFSTAMPQLIALPTELSTSGTTMQQHMQQIQQFQQIQQQMQQLHQLQQMQQMQQQIQQQMQQMPSMATMGIGPTTTTTTTTTTGQTDNGGVMGMAGVLSPNSLINNRNTPSHTFASLPTMTTESKSTERKEMETQTSANEEEENAHSQQDIINNPYTTDDHSYDSSSQDWRTTGEGIGIGGQWEVEVYLKNGYERIQGVVLCCVPETEPLCIIRQQRDNPTEGFHVHVICLDDIEKWRPLSEPKPNQEMELQIPIDRDQVLKKNVQLRKEQAARINLNVDRRIQKCFNRLHRNITGKVEWNGNAIVVNNRIIIDHKSGYRRAQMDTSMKNDTQHAESMKHSVAYINRVLDSFWHDEAEANNDINETFSNNERRDDTTNVNEYQMNEAKRYLNTNDNDISITASNNDKNNLNYNFQTMNNSTSLSNDGDYNYNNNNNHMGGTRNRKKRGGNAKSNYPNMGTGTSLVPVHNNFSSMSPQSHMDSNIPNKGNDKNFNKNKKQMRNRERERERDRDRDRDMTRSWRNSNTMRTPNATSEEMIPNDDNTHEMENESYQLKSKIATTNSSVNSYKNHPSE